MRKKEEDVAKFEESENGEREREQRTMPLGSRASLMVSLSLISALSFQSVDEGGQRARKSREGQLGDGLYVAATASYIEIWVLYSVSCTALAKLLSRVITSSPP